MARPRRRRASIRLWQTELFVTVIIVAMLILSAALAEGLKDTLTQMAETHEIRNATALAQRLETRLPLSAGGLDQVKRDIDDYRGIYDAGVWVYDASGTLRESSNDGGPKAASLETAARRGLTASPSYASVDMRKGGWVVAAKPLRAVDGTVEGVVVTASPVDSSLRILDATRYRLWVTFWVSLVVAGLLGLAFSEVIGRRIRAMSEAAAAMAAGDFEQRLPTGFVPEEVYELAESYNTMAVRLGEAFGEIQESHRHIAAVVESMAEGVVAFDAAGVVQVANPEALRLLDARDRDLVGLPAHDVTTEAAVLDIIDTGLAGRTAASTVTLGEVTARLMCTPLLETDGRVNGAVLLLADVTEQRRIEDAQRRFVADASHEMRTPVAALKGILELLADGAKDDADVRDDFINTMQVETDRLGRLVADLLTLAQLESGSLQLKMAPHSTADLLGEVARVMRTLADRVGVALIVETPDSDVRVLADHDRVVQVLLSFTDNALKHSPKGSAVRLRARREDDQVVLEVSDDGPGIDPDQLSRVFERFYRADASRAGGGGAGLGLAIAKEIVEAHGSDITVRSVPGEGTTFGFALPAADASAGRISPA